MLRNWRWFFFWPFRSHRATLVVTSDQSGQKAGFWRAAPAWDGPGFHKDALTWTSVLLLTLDRPRNGQQLMLPPGRFTLLLSARNMKAKDESRGDGMAQKKKP